eukprot:IDg13484t1
MPRQTIAIRWRTTHSAREAKMSQKQNLQNQATHDAVEEDHPKSTVDRDDNRGQCRMACKNDTCNAENFGKIKAVADGRGHVSHKRQNASNAGSRRARNKVNQESTERDAHRLQTPYATSVEHLMGKSRSATVNRGGYRTGDTRCEAVQAFAGLRGAGGSDWAMQVRWQDHKGERRCATGAER